jgi:hypothetical protein
VILPAWIVAGILMGLASLRFKVSAFVVLICAWVLMPALFQVGLILNSSGLPSRLPLTWIIFLIFIIQAFHYGKNFFKLASLPRWSMTLLSLAVLLAFLSNLQAQGLTQVGFIFDQMIAPILMFIMARSLIAVEGTRAALAVRNTVLALATLQCLIVGFVVSHALPQPYLDYYLLQPWYTASFSARQLGTLDHPLVLSVLFLVAIPLTASLRRGMLQMFLVGTFFTGILLTQSRTGLFLSILAMAFLAIRPKATVVFRLAIFLLGVVAGYILITQNVSLGVLDRLNFDGGSSLARAEAISVALTQWGTFLFQGQGVGSSFAIAAQSGLVTSFENPTLMYMFDFGLVSAILYFGTQFTLVLLGKSILAGSQLAALLGLVAVQSFSSVAAESALSSIIWILIALGTARTQIDPRDESTRTNLLENARSPRQRNPRISR